MLQQAFASPEEALAHYGVKGMRWGVRKREDTSSRQAASPEKTKELTARGQKRVEKYMKRAESAQTSINQLNKVIAKQEGSRHPYTVYARQVNRQTVKDLEKKQKRALREAEQVKKGKLTSAQKKAIIGGVAVTALLAGGLIYGAKTGQLGKLAELDQSGRVHQRRSLAKARLRGQKVPFRVNPKLARQMSAEDILKEVGKPVNPLYKTMGGNMNCRRCTYTHELRRRGFDVRATTSAVGWGQSESGVINALTTEGEDFFSNMSLSTGVVRSGGSVKAPGDLRKAPGAKQVVENLHRVRDATTSMFDTQSDSGKVLAELAKNPEGSRGEVVFKFPTFGHSMHWEIVNGKPVIFDSQKGKMYDSALRVESKWDGFSAAEIRRLDNMDLDLNFLARWATDAK